MEDSKDQDGTEEARLVAIRQAKFKIGLLKGKLGVSPDFFEPLEESELKDWEPNEL